MWRSTVVLLAVTWSFWPRTSCDLLDYDMKWFDVPISFTVESTVLLNDVSRRDKEVSYKLNSTLHIVPLPPSPPPPGDHDGGHQLIQFTVLHPYLLGRGTHVNAEYMRLPSLWDSYPKSEFYAYNNNGTFSEIYVDPAEPEDLVNFKRSLLSLFQFSYTPDVGNETDFSGTCEVQYEVMSELVIRKVKRRCSSEEAYVGGAAARRLARYSRGARGPQEVYAEEVHELHAALKARTWLRLRRAPDPAPRVIPRAVPAALRPLPLAVPLADVDNDESPSVEVLEKLLAEADELTAGGAGVGRAVAAALRLLPALRAAPPPALTALLDRAAAAGRLAEVCGMLGAAGSAAAGEAVRARLHGPGAARRALRYYEGLALAGRPEEGAVLAALRAGEEAGGEAGAAVSASALLAAGAGGARLPPAAAAAVRARLLRALDLCQEEECTASRLRALGNMRHADDTELLLRHAGGSGAAARAALGALTVGPPPALYNATRLRRLERAVLGPGALAERAAALELLLTRGARAPASLLSLLLALPAHAPPELRQLAWGRLATLARRDAGLRALLVALPARDGGWAARALSGRSAAVEREASVVGGWRVGLRASLLERVGALRRAELTVTAAARDDSASDIVTLELLEADVEAAGGGEAELELVATVDGVVLRPRRLRANTTALSWLRLAADERGARPLLGGSLLQLQRRTARAGALRVGPGGRLAVRAAAAQRVEARVAGGWGELSASALSWAAPRARLRLAAGGCARADVVPLEVVGEVRLTSALGAEQRRVRRVRGTRLPTPGRTLPLADPLRASCS
ncbi:uncharacterized protein LOC121738363 [Aricia agestis]|uniref:uncharacterized protein LOC121738363 n=1 Tax=Aricia agestis TaxID=91739 RepID=UPI001C204F3A|nr:uncharacterized protein LOC121738363 [Aricia agestis]